MNVLTHWTRRQRAIEAPIFGKVEPCVARPLANDIAYTGQRTRILYSFARHAWRIHQIVHIMGRSDYDSSDRMNNRLHGRRPRWRRARRLVVPNRYVAWRHAWKTATSSVLEKISVVAYDITFLRRQIEYNQSVCDRRARRAHARHCTSAG